MKRSKAGWWVTLSAPILAVGVVLALPIASQAVPVAAHTSKLAPVAMPPTASTGGASQVSGSSVTLAGTVNPHGAESSSYFQYGTTAAYGAQTPTAGVGNGTVQVKVTQSISGLEPGTTYHFRLVAVTSTGTIVDGPDRAFTTRKTPLKLKIAGLLESVVFGSRFTIEGVLTGTGAGDHQVVLQGSPFPYLASFTDISSPVTTNASGGFTISAVSPSLNTQLRVVTLETPLISSQVVAVRVALRVTLHLRPTGRRGYVRLYGTVTPAVVGAPVAFQLMRPGLPPVTAGGTVVRRGTSSVARFNSVVFIRHGRGGPYRAFVRVSNGKLVSGSSRAILIHSAPAPVRKRKAQRKR
jgi:hypothetical protein